VQLRAVRTTERVNNVATIKNVQTWRVCEGETEIPFNTRYMNQQLVKNCRAEPGGFNGGRRLDL